MIVNHLNLRRTFGAPPKNDSPLVVDAHGMHAFQGTFERLQPVAKWNGQVLQANGCVQVLELPLCRAPHVGGKMTRGGRDATMKKVLRQPVLEGLDDRINVIVFR
jgi:hypothetical protein